MSPRELAKVLIRVMGIGFLVYGVLAGCITILTAAAYPTAWRDTHVLLLTKVALSLAAAVCLIWRADWLAARLRTGEVRPEGSPATFSAADPASLFRVGTGLIGVACLTRITGPVSSIIYRLIETEPSASRSISLPSSFYLGRAIIELVVDLVLAIVLIVGPARIGRWIRRTFTASRPPADAPPPA